MNILIVSQYFWPESFRINDLVLGLKESGHHVTVLTGKPNYPGGYFFDGYGFFRKSRESYHGVTVLRTFVIPSLFVHDQMPQRMPYCDPAIRDFLTAELDSNQCTDAGDDEARKTPL